jgi:hypothetical protein
MPNFAQMGGNSVMNTVVGDSKEDLESVFGGEFIEITAENPAGIGWILDRETNTFSDPNPVVVEETTEETNA